MKFSQKLTPRTTLLISVGILAYIALASYHGNIKKNHAQHTAATHHHSEMNLLRQRVTAYKQKIDDARTEEDRLRKELKKAQVAAEKIPVRQKEEPKAVVNRNDSKKRRDIFATFASDKSK